MREEEEEEESEGRRVRGEGVKKPSSGMYKRGEKNAGERRRKRR